MSDKPPSSPGLPDRGAEQGDSDDGDDELELEAIDPDVIAHQQRRAQQKTDDAMRNVDVDELFRDREERDLSIDSAFLSQFRFTTRHLLIGTALLAVVMAMTQAMHACTALFVVAVVAVATGWIWVTILERRRDEERRRRREAFLQAGASQPTVTEAETPAASMAEPGPRFKIDFHFSMRQMLIAMTVAAAMLGLLQLVDPQVLALIIGMASLLGLVVNALGFDPPRMVVLGWWILLVLYLVVGLVSAVT